MKEKEQESFPGEEEHASRAKYLLREIQSRGVHAVAPLLVHESVATIAGLLTLLPDTAAAALLPTLEAERRTAILKSVPSIVRDRWIYNTRYPQETVGYLMEPVVATFSPQSTVGPDPPLLGVPGLR
jgi:magnesium transporter